ncbi:DUF917 family protein [Streptomyces sp. SID3343]|nr:DUF917 family protein [Streptomyces sp. SID3343]
MELDAGLLPDFARGCAVLGSGGGGSASVSPAGARRAVAEHGPVTVLRPGTARRRDREAGRHGRVVHGDGRAGRRRRGAPTDAGPGSGLPASAFGFGARQRPACALRGAGLLAGPADAAVADVGARRIRVGVLVGGLPRRAGPDRVIGGVP